MLQRGCGTDCVEEQVTANRQVSKCQLQLGQGMPSFSPGNLELCAHCKPNGPHLWGGPPNWLPRSGGNFCSIM